MGVRCGQCRYFDRVDDESGRQPTADGYGGCTNPKFFKGYNPDPDDLPPDGIWIENDEGWGCYVGPQFGCVHGEAK
jgi:hypothetical protein